MYLNELQMMTKLDLIERVQWLQVEVDRLDRERDDLRARLDEWQRASCESSEYNEVLKARLDGLIEAFSAERDAHQDEMLVRWLDRMIAAAKGEKP